MNITPTDPAEEDVEVLRDKQGAERVELWTDGEWIRLGRDVLGNRYFEVKVENFRDFIETLRAQAGVESHSITDSGASDESLIVDAGHSLDIYRNQKHILYYRDHEYGVLYSALNRAQEIQETFDYDTLVRSYINSIIPSLWEITYLKEKHNHKFSVEVEDMINSVNWTLVNRLEEEGPINFSNGSRNIYCEDGQMRYQFTLQADKLSGAPDETAE